MGHLDQETHLVRWLMVTHFEVRCCGQWELEMKEVGG